MAAPAFHEPVILRDAIVFLLAAIVVVPLFRRFGVNAVIGYLVAGAIIGPHGLALVHEVEGTHQLAELGVVFMLFSIGLELSPERLRVMARYVFGLGVAQVVVTGTVLAAGVLALGASPGQAAVIGGALALSSTAFVLQLLSQRGELHTHFGRVVLSVLLLQDLAVVPGLAVVTALGSQPDALSEALAIAAAKAVAALALILVVGRWVLRPLYRMIAGMRSPELFAAATLLVVLGTTWGMIQAGLSTALGAFLAGLMLAGTEYRHQIEADIRPARGLLLGLFFISIGMLVDFRTVAPRLPEILAATALLVLAKATIMTGLCRLFQLPLPLAATVGLHLAQGGEFAFVLISLAMGTGVLPVQAGQFLLTVVAITMALTPLLGRIGQLTQSWLQARAPGGLASLASEAEALTDHVVIAGFGRVGRTIAAILDARKIRWIAVDLDPINVAAARAQGLPVFFGDASNEVIIHATKIGQARAAVITLDAPSATASVLRMIRSELPDIPVVVRARDAENMDELLRNGASQVMPETIESSLLLGGMVLKTLGDSDAKIEEVIGSLRQAAYQASGSQGVLAWRSAPEMSKRP
ncbi:monovalent cation:proton antiporter-2 (CPA2) family protein [Pseudaminobacter soli (ex Li et al. 2025)]|uniref:Potassium transporter KefB n=1 Tax=Pseudaminobacter soli (ex Li et al. 2025) TaxID=1295366 RepID=A0A2P7S2F0_9HYPH|nr:monovalent cation:proton antiporter-2 (CPA2) family protein [Mesorhizobium soli]PSJ56644.1 potassium transporter KefB [Mesorhizobium soli]